MIWFAAAFAVFLWWFSTGVILMALSRADRGGPGGHMNTVLAGLPALVAGLAGIVWSAGETSVAGAFVGFSSAILIWGWLELAFLAGVITGPVRRGLPPGSNPWQRFMRAWGAIAYHELSLILALIWIIALSWEAEHQYGLWTFLILLFARISAKLNVFFGVPNINEDFLPRPVRHIGTYFRRRRMNWVFPFAVTLLAFATFCWVERAVAMPDGSGSETGFVLLAAITALALLEHWLMIIPLPDAALWRWMMAAPTPKSPDSGGLAALPEAE